MDKRFLVKFAFKNLMMHKSRTVLTVLGVTVGIAAIVFLVAFAFGIEKLVTGEVTKGNAYQLIDVGTGNIQALRLNEDTISQLKTIAQVKSVEPTVNLGAAAKVQDKATDVTLSGTSDKYIEWSGISTRWGTGIDSTRVEKPIIVNNAFVKFLGSRPPDQYIGQKVSFDIVIPKEITGAEATKATDAQFEIVGIIQDTSVATAYARYADVSELGAKNFSQLKVESSTQDKTKIDAIRKQIENLGFKTQYVGDTVSQIEQIFQVFKIILGSFGLIALIVAALGMFNTLTISLLERTKEVALLKILGMRRRDISSIFLTEAISIGVLGGIVGIITGYLIGLGANSLFNHFATQAGGESVLVFMFPLWFMIAMWAFAVLLGFFTGVYPARRATKINALDVLRYE
ncbi:MAG: FtsX-like permease family protein [Candidatus Berkelbacteria bacterium]|nr:FtsX-like permease family protein [Candidatus Berkelbacteria bacterium]